MTIKTHAPALLATLLVSLLLAAPASARDWYVDGSAAGPGTGTRARPYRTIQSAINRARSGDTVLVAIGTYRETITLKNGVDVEGAAILDCENVRRGIRADGISSRVHVLDFTVINGKERDGAAAYVTDSKVSFRNCTFRDNAADNNGGAVYVADSDVKFTACLFADNEAVANGGGIFCDNSTIDLQRGRFEGNRALHLIPGGFTRTTGGALSVTRNSTITLTGTEFAQNRSALGGAIALEHSEVSATRCEFTENNARAEGGAVEVSSLTGASHFYDLNNVYWKNEATSAGGALHVSGSFQLVNSTFHRNQGGHEGDGLYLVAGSGTITNCIFWQNPDSEIFLGGRRASVTVDHSCVAGGYAGVGNIADDPLFTGGERGAIRLRATSPCIDRGRNDAPATSPIDIDRRPRVVPGSAGAPAIIDMGAAEYDPSYIPPLRAELWRPGD